MSRLRRDGIDLGNLSRWNEIGGVLVLGGSHWSGVHSSVRVVGVCFSALDPNRFCLLYVIDISIHTVSHPVLQEI